MNYSNLDLTSVVSPVDVDKLEQLLIESEYDASKTKYLINSFRNGFDLGYRGQVKVKRTAPNLKLRMGSPTILWNKVMKEVKERRYAGPFSQIPFEHYIQSPIGLVSKDGGANTRLIFHLSYPRSGDSVNSCTPREFCTVKYPSFDDAIKLCLREIKQGIEIVHIENGKILIFLGKSDLRSAFCNLGMFPGQFCFLVMKAKSPIDQKTYYFVDKCLPFGASISCAHFQNFADALKHIMLYKTGKDLVNYLDDFLFMALLRAVCDAQIQQFLDLCESIKFPVSIEKTVWGDTWIIFLGLLINAVQKLICIPEDKITRAIQLIDDILNQKKHKATVHQIQKLCGFLNFIGRGIVPGRAFTRRLYAVTGGKEIAKRKLKPHHHVRLTSENILDLKIWRYFLQHPTAYCRPFMDLSDELQVQNTTLHTDSSKNPKLGCGGWCESNWFFVKWNEQFVIDHDPSIAYLDLYALAIGVKLWMGKFRNKRILIHCDNQAVVQMVNNNTSSCPHCMKLIRIIVLESLIQNVRIYAKFIDTKSNAIADSLSRLQFDRFMQLTNGKMNTSPETLPKEFEPMSKVW